MRSPLSFETGDLRALARQIGVKATAEVRNLAEEIVRQEIKVTADRLRARVSAIDTEPSAVARRSGRLLSTIASSTTRTPYTVSGEVGFMKHLNEVNRMKIVMHTRIPGEPAGTEITPKRARKLAFPVRGRSPRSIIDNRGQHMTVEDASQHWDELRYTKSSIQGRMKGQRRWTFLFLRRSSVFVPKRIDLGKEADRLEARVMKRLEKEL
jgi:hypothetical protein